MFFGFTVLLIVKKKQEQRGAVCISSSALRFIGEGYDLRNINWCKTEHTTYRRSNSYQYFGVQGIVYVIMQMSDKLNAVDNRRSQTKEKPFIHDHCLGSFWLGVIVVNS